MDLPQSRSVFFFEPKGAATVPSYEDLFVIRTKPDMVLMMAWSVVTLAMAAPSGYAPPATQFLSQRCSTAAVSSW